MWEISESAHQWSDRNNCGQATLSRSQVEAIKSVTGRVLRWESLWTFDQEDNEAYGQFSGGPISVRVLVLGCAVVVFVPRLAADHPEAVVVLVRLPDGRLGFGTAGGWMKAYPDERARIATAVRGSLGWNRFRAMSKDDNGPLGSRGLDCYENCLSEGFSYWGFEVEVQLSASENDGLVWTKRHERLLGAVEGSAIACVETMFSGQRVTITIPRFALGDPRILVLIESEDLSVVADFLLTTEPENVSLLGFFIKDIDAEPDPTDAVRKVRQRAAKMIVHSGMK